ncbi:putative protein N(5)-glutamine methyltransferase [Peribacillus kribbensis]|uniref:putative protein N(5)-glutamine methyltransferase n=1 Tax=Peribacillus kribbensis TaxID=356658 RepID=UPI00040016C0|nr:putative protein N(5)-glutamine methyltransferase [Peribacillus kribbensis]
MRTLRINEKLERMVIDKLLHAGCVFAEEEAELLIAEAKTSDELLKMTESRALGAPIEYVLGYTCFCGLRINVERNVFVPRRRTEFLAEKAKAIVQDGDRVVDLCCGSGAIGAAIASGADIHLHAVDIDEAAVRCAKRNLSGLGAHVYQGDLYSVLPRSLKGSVKMIAANIPYVPTGFIDLLPQEARLHEPKSALDGGEDGFMILRKVAAEAPEWLAPGGDLMIETSGRQASKAAEIFEESGLTARIAKDKDLDATVIIGRLKRLQKSQI